MPRLTRREALLGSACLMLAPRAGFAQGLSLSPLPVRQQLGPEGTGPADLVGYQGRVPGPLLRVKQGERLRVRLDNRWDRPTTIHWHGIRIDNAMDGVAHLTQAPVGPGESFYYDFVCPDAGTFWYHPHSRSWEQMALGLYGMLIVEEADPPAVDRDLPMVIDDWQLVGDGSLADNLGNFHDWSHAGALGNWPTVNGAPQPEFAVKRNERLRLRLLNTCNATVLTLVLKGMDATVVAEDGQPVTPRPLGEAVLAPGQRIDVIADVTGEGELRLGGYEDFRLATFALAGEARPTPLGAVAPLPANPLTQPSGTPREVSLRLSGGAMSWLDEAEVGGHFARMEGVAPGPMDGRKLSEAGLFWAMNGIAGMPDAPLFAAARGETVALTYINDTRFPHAMHTHGHHALDGEAWRDTVLLAPGETRRVLIVADNPGKWMLHCHMLEHQAAGMGTWYSVA